MMKRISIHLKIQLVQLWEFFKNNILQVVTNLIEKLDKSLKLLIVGDNC